MTILSVVATGFTAAGLPAALHRSARHPKNCLTGINRTNQRRARIAAKKFEEMHFCAGSLSAPWAPDLKSSLQARPTPRCTYALHACISPVQRRCSVQCSVQCCSSGVHPALQRAAPDGPGGPWPTSCAPPPACFAHFLPTEGRLVICTCSISGRNLAQNSKDFTAMTMCQVEGYTLSWIYAN